MIGNDQSTPPRPQEVHEAYLILKNSDLFDVKFYLDNNPDVRDAAIDPLMHYLTNGSREGRDPSTKFSTRYYVATYSDVALSGLNPLVHFLRIGALEGRVAVPPPDMTPGILSVGDGLILDETERQWYKAIEKSNLFDAHYYLDCNPDVAAAGHDPLTHYIKNGCHENRDPNKDFHTRYYVATFPDVRETGLNPLYHYITIGQSERRTPRAQGEGFFMLTDEQVDWYKHIRAAGVFDSDFYLLTYPDVASSGLDPLVHYIISGADQDRLPNRSFNPLSYLSSNRDIYFSKTNILYHQFSQSSNTGTNKNPPKVQHFHASENEKLSSGSMVEIARQRMQLSDWEGAAGYWRKILETDKTNLEAHDGLITSLLQSHLLVAAIDALAAAKANLSADGYRHLSSIESQIFSSEPAIGVGQSNALTSSPRTPIRTERLRARLKHSPLFDPIFYTQNRPDNAGFYREALDHYLKWGSVARLPTCSGSTIAKLLGWTTRDYENDTAKFLQSFEDAQREDIIPEEFLKSARIGIFIHTQSNFYMRPIAEHLQAALYAAGAQVAILSELDPHPEAVTIPIVVAPHEFFGFRLPPYFQSQTFAKIYIAFNTEQLPSDWFKECFSDLMAARAVIDVNFQSALILNKSLPTTYCLPAVRTNHWPDYISDADPSHDQLNILDPKIIGQFGLRPDFEERPLDVFFAGFATSHRDTTLVRAAAYLASKKSYLAYGKKSSTAKVQTEQTMSVFANNLALCGLSKIVLNIHRFSIGYFEWERMVAQGFLARSCVITTPSLPSPFFTPGVHYLEVPGRHVSPALRWLLDSEEGKATAKQFAAASSDVMQHSLTPVRVGRHLLSFLASLPELS
ncbi:hypothetical protein MKK88_16040 [Methylobacterium sp. E-005]|uniref:hypothetical protein n=1 Tax=Methylobacterium sp. E-005 TaxID=2836549 RepID=UPI001FBA517E|nr:hypothetical protein [Methylobacterium sp. E-005]MCJ2087480.1 hypothetical protein [Methylobacterium sp. E-005]